MNTITKKKNALTYEEVRDIIEECASTARRDNAHNFHFDFMENLKNKGWKYQAEYNVEDRYDGRPGRIDVVVFEPVIVGIELDNWWPRRKSIFKLKQINGLRYIILRNHHLFDGMKYDTPEDIDEVICCGVERPSLYKEAYTRKELLKKIQTEERMIKYYDRKRVFDKKQ